MIGLGQEEGTQGGGCPAPFGGKQIVGDGRLGEGKDAPTTLGFK